MSENSDKKDNLSLEKITRIVLIFGILAVSGGIIYKLTEPPEKDVLFFILNQDQVLRDYPTNTTVNTSLNVYSYVENHLQAQTEFAIRVYRGNSSLVHNSTLGVSENVNAVYLFNQTKILENDESWISDVISVSFPEIGDNQQIILELWKKTSFGWEYIPEYITFLRIEVFS